MAQQPEAEMNFDVRTCFGMATKLAGKASFSQRYSDGLTERTLLLCGGIEISEVTSHYQSVAAAAFVDAANDPAKVGGEDCVL